MNILKLFSTFILALCSYGAFAQQLALGKSPFLMNKSAILELNADNQGFLLPRITDTTLINALTPPDGMVIFFSPTKQIMVRTNGYWKALAPSGNYITGLAGDLTAAGPGTATGTVTGIRGATVPALTTGFLKYNGTGWFFDNSTYLSTANYNLQQVTTNGNTSDVGVDLTFKGNAQTSYALKLIRSKDQNPNGYLIRGTTSNGTTDIFTVDAEANVTANSFVKTGGTSSQFLKADGSVDNTTYLAATGGNGYIQNQAAVNQSADMRISGKAMVGGVVTDNGTALQVAGSTTVSGKVTIGNTTTSNANLDVSGEVALRMGSYTATNNGNNNIVVNNNAFVRIAGPGASFTITGIAGGYDGRMIILYNATTSVMTLAHDDNSSTTTNRIYCSGNINIAVNSRGCATLLYSDVDKRWIVVSTK